MNTYPTPLMVANFQIRRDGAGRYCLNDLHQASGGAKRHQPSNWLRLQQTTELIRVLKARGALSDPKCEVQILISEDLKPVETTEGRYGGVYAVKQLVYAFAMWISPEFHLDVINAYDTLVTQGTAPAEPMQPAALHDTRSQVVARLYRARGAAEQQAQFEHAVQLSLTLGLPAPELPPCLPLAHTLESAQAQFWAVVSALQSTGHDINHARAAGHLALNLRQVQQLAASTGLSLPTPRSLHGALRASPYFVRANWACNSVIANKIVKCWVFAK